MDVARAPGGVELRPLAGPIERPYGGAPALPAHAATAWSRAAAGFLSLFVLLMPFSRSPGILGLNLQWSDVAALGFLLTSAAAGVWRRPGHRPALFACLIYLALLLPSFARTHDVPGSLLELVKTVYLVVLGLAMARWTADERDWNRLMRVSAATTTAMIILTLGVWVWAVWLHEIPGQLAVAMDVPSVGHAVRVNGLLHSPTFLANYFTMGVPLLAGYVIARSSRPRALGWGTIAAGVLATAATVSHSLAGCLAAAALVAPRTTRWDRWGRRGLWGLAVGVFIFGLVSTTVAVHEVRTSRASAPGSLASLADHEFAGPTGAGETLSVQVRYTRVVYSLLKQFAWEAWRRHPWVGIGLDQFPYEVRAAFQAGRIHAYYAGGVDPHSTWFGAMAETGLLGLLGLAGFWIMLLRAAWPSRRHIARASEAWRLRAPLAGLVGLLVNSVHVDIMHFRFLWMGAALVLAVRASNPRPTRHV